MYSPTSPWPARHREASCHDVPLAGKSSQSSAPRRNQVQEIPVANIILDPVLIKRDTKMKHLENNFFPVDKHTLKDRRTWSHIKDYFGEKENP